MTNAQTARAWLLDSAEGRGRRSRSTSSPSRPTRRRSRSSASTPRTCSASGTGSAAATRCGRRSACRSRSSSAWTLRGAARRRPRDGRALPHRAAGAEPAGDPGPARRLVQQLLRRHDATPSCPTTSTCTASPPTSSRATWRPTARRRPRRHSRSTTRTGPIIWGEPGTNGQHAFYQLIHQGTKLIPCDFLAAVRDAQPARRPPPDPARQLLRPDRGADAAARPRTRRAPSWSSRGCPGEALDALVPHKVFPGNRPTNSILLPEARRRGRLGIADRALRAQDLRPGRSSGTSTRFDQWGVELGKQLAKAILPELRGGAQGSGHDASTNGPDQGDQGRSLSKLCPRPLGRGGRKNFL